MLRRSSATSSWTSGFRPIPSSAIPGALGRSRFCSTALRRTPATWTWTGADWSRGRSLSTHARRMKKTRGRGRSATSSSPTRPSSRPTRSSSPRSSTFRKGGRTSGGRAYDPEQHRVALILSSLLPSDSCRRTWATQKTHTTRTISARPAGSTLG